MAPIDLLPPEVLRAIFLLLQDGRRNRSNMLRVCRQWHDIVITTARFWTKIILKDVIGVHLEDIIGLATLSAKRASNLPLDIILDLSLNSERIAGTGIKVAFQQFTAVAPTSRWKSLIVQNAEGEIKECIQPTGFDILEQLHIDIKRNGGFDTMFLRVIDQTALKLSTLYVSPYWHTYKSNLTHSLNRIFFLRLPDISDTDVGLPPNIKRFELGMIPFDRIKLENITHMIIRYMNLDRIYTLDLPNLQSLMIYKTNDDPKSQLRGSDNYERYITPLYPNLRHLIVPYPVQTLLSHTLSPSLVLLDIGNALPSTRVPGPIRIGVGPGAGAGLGTAIGIMNDESLILSQTWNWLVNHPNFPSSLSTLRLAVNPPTMPTPLLLAVLARLPKLEHLVLSISSPNFRDQRQESLLKELSTFLSTPLTHSLYSTPPTLFPFVTSAAISQISDEEGKDGEHSRGWLHCPVLVSLGFRIAWRQLHSESWFDYAKEILAGRLGSTMKYVEYHWSDGNHVKLSA